MDAWGFDTTNVEVNFGTSSQLPLSTSDDGWLVKITKAGVVDIRSGRGKRVEFTLQMLDGVHKGLSYTWSLNTLHENETTQRIDRGRVAAVCQTLGLPYKPKFPPFEAFYNRPFRITVKPAKDPKYVEVSVLNRPANTEQAATPPPGFELPAPAAQNFTAPPAAIFTPDALVDSEPPWK